LPTVDENGNPSGIIKSVDLLEQYYLSPYEREYGQRPKTQTRAFKADPASSLNVPAKNFISKVPLIVDRNEDLYSVVEKMGQTKTLTVMVFSGKGYKEITSKDILKLIMDTSIPEVQNIRFVGLNKLDIEPSMKDTIKRVCSMHAQKFQFYIKNIFDVVVHIKEYSKTGRKHNFLIHVRLNYPGGTLSSHNRNWNLLTGVQLAFTEVENLIRHKFKRNVKEIVPAKRFFEEDGTGTEVEEA
jgi:ribosome-associated translation inhibitor RaiA